MQLEAIRSQAQYQEDNWSQVDGLVEQINVQDNTLVIGGQELRLSENANVQFLERIGISNTLKDFNVKDDFEVLDHAIKYRIQHQNPKFPHRVVYDTRTNEAKAFKTPRYNTEIKQTQVISAAIAKYGDKMNVRDSFIDDNFLCLSFQDIDKREAVPGDWVGFGAQIWNSGTGRSSLSASMYMIRLICANGSTAPGVNVEGMSIKHIGNTLREKMEFAINTVIKPDATVLHLQHAIKRPALVSSIKDAHKILSKFAIRKEHMDGIEQAYLQEPLGTSNDGINGYGLFQAVTRYASNLYPTKITYKPIEQQVLYGAAYPLLTL